MLDSLRTQIQRDVMQIMAGHREISLATVASYNPNEHTARVRLQPEGDETGDLHIIPAWHGLRAPLEHGMTCLVAWDHGQPVAIVGGGWYDDAHTPPLSAFFFPDDVHVAGTLSVGSLLQPATVAVLPPASAATAGCLVTLAATGSVDAALYYCVATHDNSYVWKAVTLA